MNSDVAALLISAADHAQNGQHDEAEAEYSRVLLSYPESRLARFELGTLQFMRGHIARAFVTWLPLTQRRDALTSYVLSYASLASSDMTAAIAYIEQGLSTGSGIAPLDANLSLLLHALRSEQSLPQAHERAPAHVDYLVDTYRQSVKPMT